MKTIILNCSWLGEDPSTTFNPCCTRLDRAKHFLNYYTNIQKYLGFNEIWSIDDASPIDNLNSLQCNIYNNIGNCIINNNSIMNVIRYENHLGRKSVWDFKSFYRMLNNIPFIINLTGCDKILLIDTDAYILSEKLATYFKELSTGINAVFCKKYGFPELSLTCICSNKFNMFKAWLDKNPEKLFNGKYSLEDKFPFTNISKQFIGDRYGETKEIQTVDMDFYCQWELGIKLNFRNS